MVRHIIKKLSAILTKTLPLGGVGVGLFLLSSCARMGSPDGGWYDDTPPHVISSTPADGGINIKAKKVTINFNEYIKLEDAQNKVIVSPPQLEMADIKASGKRVIVELKDSLKDNTTYTIDFSDAISDNNEGNPMGNYTFSFSTGDHIDTLEVSGYCLNAEDLEPIKGILVGLYPADSLNSLNHNPSPIGEGSIYSQSNDSSDSLLTKGLSDSLLSKGLSDSINSQGQEPYTTLANQRGAESEDSSFFRTTPMMRVSRTNGSGQFTIKGVAPGSYVVYALMDADGDFLYSQKSEVIGYSNDSIVPTWKPDTRQDTIWRDTLHIDNILRKPYTHFLPDDVTLLCFQEPQTDRYLVKYERQSPQKLSYYFSYGHDSLPDIEGLNFNSDSAFVVDASAKRDSVNLWLRDTMLVNQDTLQMVLKYYKTDTLGVLQVQRDTLEMVSKISYERRQKDKLKEIEKWEKDQERKKKRGLDYDSIMPTPFMKYKINASSAIDPNQVITFEMPEPLAHCDTSAIHLYVQIDSVWYRSPHKFRQRSPLIYELTADWQLATEYSLEIDSAAFKGIYGLWTDKTKMGFKVRSEDDFSTLTVNISGMDRGDSVMVQLLDASDKVQRQQLADAGGTVEFIYLKPATYYLRAFIDSNGNGVWDTGNYDIDLQAEAVYYFNEEIECKAQWDNNRKWNLKALPRFKQKPAKITKQKPDQQKKQRNRNIERARKMGKEYLRETTGIQQ